MTHFILNFYLKVGICQRNPNYFPHLADDCPPEASHEPKDPSALTSHASARSSYRQLLRQKIANFFRDIILASEFELEDYIFDVYAWSSLFYFYHHVY